MRRSVGWAVSVVIALVFLTPILWMLLASLRPDDQVFSGGFLGVLSVSDWTFQNYADAWRRGAVWLGFLNSLIQVAVIVAGGLLVNSMAAYAFARMDFRGRNVLFACVVILIILPLEVLVVPLLLTARDLHLTGGHLGTLSALTLPFMAKAFNIYFLRQHFMQIPTALEEAATMDGAGPFRTFFFIALPVIRPALATVALIDILIHWSDFIWPLMVCTREQTRTIQLSLANLFTQPPVQWGDVLACAAIATVPVLIFFKVFGRFVLLSDMGAGLR